MLTRIFHSHFISTGLQPGVCGRKELGAASAAFARGGKPLKRLLSALPFSTGLKPGANEKRDRKCEISGPRPILQKTWLALCLFTALVASAQSPVPGQPVVASVDATKTGTPISPYVYGQFIEHAGGLIYSGLWCEMLEDRKFYYAVKFKPAEDPNASQRGPDGGTGRRRNVGPGRWNPIGPVDSVVMDTSNPFVGDHTPLIKLTGSEPRGIRQTGVNFTQGVTYNGRIQLAGDPAAKVSLNVVCGTNADAVRQTVSLGDLSAAYKKITFSFQAEHSGAAQFEIIGIGTGSFRVGAVSLMPADNLEGFKPDAIAALKSLRSGVYRFPGGNFVSAHEWRYAIGEMDKRPPIYDPVWRAVQPNDIGTDEFMTLCQLLGVEPYITVNAGTGDDWSAA